MIRPGVRRFFSLALRTRRGREQDVHDEIASHFELRIEQLMRGGLSYDAARALAQERFGPLDRSKEQLLDTATRREARMQWNEQLDSVRQDAGFAVRQLRRSPGFAITTILTLALGIGANATMFGIVDRLLLEPPAHVTDPARVATVSVEMGTTAKHTQERLSLPIYYDLLNTAAAFSDVSAYNPATLSIGDGQTAQLIPAVAATASYFRALGVAPLAGRFFTDDETDQAPGAHVIVLGYQYWQRRMGGATNVIGSTVPVGDDRYRVIGIAPAGFTGLGLSEVAAWVPLTASMTAPAYASQRHKRTYFSLSILARLRAGVSYEAAIAQGSAAMQSGALLDELSPEEARQLNQRLILTSALPRDARGSRADSKVAMLVAAVSLLVLIIACANVANLQLARALTRRREVAIRLALGVSRSRLVRQLALDGLILSLAGGAAALLVVVWGGQFVRRLLLGGAASTTVPVSWRVLAFTGVAAVLVGIVTGLAPALQSMRTDLAHALRTGGRGTHGSFSRTRFMLIGVQAALTVVLLVGTVLFVRSLRRIESVPLGMDSSHVLSARINRASLSYTNVQLARDYDRLEEAASTLPDVQAVSRAMMTPFSSSTAVQVSLPGRDSVPLTRDGGPYYNAVGPNFFRTMGTRVIRGRSFTASDRAGSSPVLIVNETLANLWWPNENPIGKCARVGEGDSVPCAQIVGVVEDTRRHAIIEEPSVMLFTPFGQGPAFAQPYVLFIRTRRPAADVASVMGTRLRAAAASMPFVSVTPLDNLIAPQMQSWKLGAMMFGLFAALAIVLASVGLYGVMAYDVAQRTSELGVRMALGAQAADVRRLVLFRGLRIATLGGGVGLVLAFVAGARVAPLLFRTSPHDPAAFALAAAVLAAVTMAATLVPALRASRVDPNSSLRAE